MAFGKGKSREEELAGQFVSAVCPIGQRRKGGVEQAVEEVLGTELLISDGFQGGVLPNEVFEVVIAGVQAALSSADITSTFKAHLLQLVMDAASFSEFGFAGPDLIIREAGVDIQSKPKRLGIFDSKTAMETEKAAYQANLPNRFAIEELAKEHQRKMLAWKNNYKVKYRQEP